MLTVLLVCRRYRYWSLRRKHLQFAFSERASIGFCAKWRSGTFLRMVLSRSQKRDAFCDLSRCAPQAETGRAAGLDFGQLRPRAQRHLPFAIVAPSLGFNEVCKEFCAFNISVIFRRFIPIFYQGQVEALLGKEFYQVHVSVLRVIKRLDDARV